MESEFVATCENCGLSPIQSDDLGEDGSCPQCGSEDLIFEVDEVEVDLFHPGPGPGWA